MNRPKLRNCLFIAIVAPVTLAALLASASARAQTAAPRAGETPKMQAEKEGVTLTPTRPGSYTYWSVGKNGAGSVSRIAPDAKTAVVPLTPDLREVDVLNEADGTLAVFPAARWKTNRTISITPNDFKYVRQLVAKVTAADGKPVRSAVVTLTDTSGKTESQVLSAENAGRATFANVPMGAAKLTAVYGDRGPKATQEVTIAPGAGGQPAEVMLLLSGDVPTVDTAPANAPAGTPAAPAAPTTSDLPPLSQDAPNAAPAERGPDWISGVIGIVVLAAAGFFGLRAARNRGMTVPGTLKQLGVEMPQDAAANAPGPFKPAAPPAPPLPSLADLPAAGPASSVAGAVAERAAPASDGQSGPRLVGVAGPVTGETFPLEDGTAFSIGRDPDNALALTQDTTVSRRHARVEAQSGGFAVVDQGSSNGTFVNGVSTPAQALQPGDEIQIGTARFRYEG